MDELFESIKRIKTMAESYLPMINSDITRIIATHSHDKKHIESLLDILMDYNFLGVGKTEFDRLNEYYKTFDEEAYNDYKRIYEELLGKEE